MRMARLEIRTVVRELRSPRRSVCRAQLRDLTHAHPFPPDRSKPAVNPNGSPRRVRKSDRVSRCVA